MARILPAWSLKTAVLVLAAIAVAAPRCAAAAERPNILWLTCEDMSPNLGCWDDAYATTPNIDRLAAQSVRYTNAFSTAPVCSPARSCLITGMYATTLGTQNLRSSFPLPAEIRGFPAFLREAGYYTTNNVKTDYNTSSEPAIVRAAWDVSSAEAHWRNRPAGKPFFAVFNDMVTHQSRTSVFSYAQFQQEVQSELPAELRHDPAKAPVPPYWPDTPISRRTIARYYDCITLMDRHVGKLLEELDDSGLADDTIVFFYSDHGAGLPRHKRLVLDSGLHVPLIVRFPEKYRHLSPAAPGAKVNRLVSFVDFAPTVLSLAGLPIPNYMQGTAFLGPSAGPPRQFVYGARDRVDEAYDLARSVRDERWLYVRNYMPHVSYNQPEGYSDQAEVRQEITRLFAEGKLNSVQMAYAGPTRPVEELYDTSADPWQVKNLAEEAEHRAVLERLRAEHRRWALETRDLGYLPESEIAARSAGSTPYATARRPDRYPLERILNAASLVGRRDVLDQQIELFRSRDAAVRYWAAVGLRAQGDRAVEARTALTTALGDPAPAVRIEAAVVLAGLGDAPQAIDVLAKELQSDDDDVLIRASRALELFGDRAAPALPAMQAALADRGRAADVKLYLQFTLAPAVKRLTTP